MIGPDAVVVAEFWVRGRPAPQGSKKPYIRGGRAVLVESAKTTLVPWREAVRATAAAEWAGRAPLTGAVGVELEIYLPRPRSARRSAEYPTTRPDVDKIIRGCLDAIRDSGIYGDDGQVVQVLATKRLTHPDGVPAPGARVRIVAIEEMPA